MPKPKCEHCEYWVPGPNGEDGYCYLLPPQVIVSGLGIPDKVRVITKADEWCGQLLPNQAWRDARTKEQEKALGINQ